MSLTDMDAMAMEVEGKEDISTPRVQHFSQFVEEEEEKSKSSCQCVCPLWCLVTLILFALILGIAGVTAYNLYANITNSNKLTIVEEAASQETIVQLLNVTNNHSIEIALEEFVNSVNDDLRRVESDIEALRNDTSNTFDQVRSDIRLLDTDIANRLSQIENSTLAKEELARVESDLASLEDRVATVEEELNSGKPLSSGHPLLIAGIGLLALQLVRF